jgi:hypothetical protein
LIHYFRGFGPPPVSANVRHTTAIPPSAPRIKNITKNNGARPVRPSNHHPMAVITAVTTTIWIPNAMYDPAPRNSGNFFIRCIPWTTTIKNVCEKNHNLPTRRKHFL